MNNTIILLLVALAGAFLLRSLFVPTLVGGVLGTGAVMLGPVVNVPVDERLAFLALAGGFILGFINMLAQLAPAKKKDDKKK